MKTLTTIVGALAVGTVMYVVLVDTWFHTGLVGRGIAILILSGMVWAIWLGGYVTAMKELDHD